MLLYYLRVLRFRLVAGCHVHQQLHGGRVVRVVRVVRVLRVRGVVEERAVSVDWRDPSTVSMFWSDSIVHRLYEARLREQAVKAARERLET